MVNKYIVECPHCKMRFFVTDALLATANGALRCGFCLYIFQGEACIVYEAMGNTVPIHSPQVATDHKENEQVTTEAYKSGQSEVIEKDSYSEEYWQEVVNKFSGFSTVVGDGVAQSPGVVDKQQHGQRVMVESIEVRPSKEFVFKSVLNDIDDDIKEYLNKVDLDHCLQMDEEALVASQNKVVDNYLENIDVTQGELELPTERDVNSISKSSYNNNMLVDSSAVVRDIYGNELKVISEVDFDNFTPPHKIINKGSLVWGILSILALLFLVAQYLHFAVPKMAMGVTNRAWAEKVCGYVLCSLPVQVDVDKIKTDKLVVRDDPNHTKVLLVDSIIYNMASFPQPYPIIELRFTDLNGQTVASRRFSPQEYLNDEALEKNQMPSNMPVYISFQIVDPGDNATGYSLHYYVAPSISSRHH